MMKHIRTALIFVSLLLFSAVASATVKGIYLTQYTMQNTTYLNHLIKNAKASGINTFVIDYEYPNEKYRQNIASVNNSGIKYVARIVMFPDGGTPYAINDPAFWQRKYDLVKQAIALGAKEIQLDYIRFNSAQKPSPENAQKILTIIKWYKEQLAGQNIPLQVDVFGIASFGESKYIGQNIKLFSQSVDAICPMVYPSHYTPFKEHFNTPYNTVLDSLASIKKQLDENTSVKMIPYIELSNYHFPMSRPKTLEYIQAQLKAAHQAGADGWYAWSPHNRYDNLFKVLQSQ